MVALDGERETFTFGTPVSQRLLFSDAHLSETSVAKSKQLSFAIHGNICGILGQVVLMTKGVIILFNRVFAVFSQIVSVDGHVGRCFKVSMVVRRGTWAASG